MLPVLISEKTAELYVRDQGQSETHRDTDSDTLNRQQKTENMGQSGEFKLRFDIGKILQKETCFLFLNATLMHFWIV